MNGREEDDDRGGEKEHRHQLDHLEAVEGPGIFLYPVPLATIEGNSQHDEGDGEHGRQDRSP